MWDNVYMAFTDAPLHHVIVVGGTSEDWSAMSDGAWRSRLDDLGKVVDRVGGRWLSVRPRSGDATRASSTVPADLINAPHAVGDCAVEVQPATDGRQRLADVVAALVADGVQISEQAISQRLNAPAEVDPDLVVVLGPSNLLPPSLVWELAYSELVFVDMPWSEFGAEQLEAAIESYTQRHRRFGGVD